MQNVALDKSRYDLYRGALSCDNHVDTASARKLRDTHDILFDGIVLRFDHEIRHLVDDKHDPLHLGLFSFIAVQIVVLVDVAAPYLLEERIPPVHLLRKPLEHVDRVTGFLDCFFYKEVGQSPVNAHLDALGVYHYHSDVLRRILVKYADYDRVKENALARSGRARDEKVGHFREVRHVRFAVESLAERHSYAFVALVEFLGAKYALQSNRVALRVGKLDTECVLSLYRSLYTQIFHAQTHFKILFKRGDFVDFVTGTEFEIIHRKRRSALCRHHFRRHVEFLHRYVYFLFYRLIVGREVLSRVTVIAQKIVSRSFIRLRYVRLLRRVRE